MLDSNCNGPNVPWWQAFPVYKELENRRTVFRWGQPPSEPAPICTSPLFKARRYSGLLKNDPFVKTHADLARELGVSRVRITQVMNLLKLAPEIQEHLLRMEEQKAVRFFSERRLRPLIQIDDPKRQVREFQRMLTWIQR